MAIITEQNDDKKPKKLSNQDWIDLGAKWIREGKKSGKTRRQFAELNNVLPATFERALSRFKNQIKEEVIKLDALPINKVKSNKNQEIINQFRDGLRVRAKDSGAANNNKSMKWFNDVIKTSIRGHKVSTPTPGLIYAYAYDAKNKDTLPYWDRFPLIIYLGKHTAKNGNTILTGLNLHYIPPRARQEFLEKLLVYSSNKKFSNNTKLKIDWSKVKSMKYAPHMIKAYLPNHIVGTMTEVKQSDWINVIYMPTQQFMSKGSKFSSQKVWANSTKR